MDFHHTRTYPKCGEIIERRHQHKALGGVHDGMVGPSHHHPIAGGSLAIDWGERTAPHQPILFLQDKSDKHTSSL